MVFCWFDFKQWNVDFWIFIHGYRLINTAFAACLHYISEFWKVICVGKHSRPRFSSSWIRWVPLNFYLYHSFLYKILLWVYLCHSSFHSDLKHFYYHILHNYVTYIRAMSEIVCGIYSGIVTRRPLVLQLHKTDDGQQEYAEFGHLPRRRFTDFGISNNLHCFLFFWGISLISPRPHPAHTQTPSQNP